MATKARRAGSLSRILNANTAASSNVIVIDSGGDISVSGNLTVSGGVIGYITNAHLQQIFAQNSAISGIGTDGLDDRLQVANASVLYVTKAGALTTNNAVVNVINDRLQVANAAVTYVTKAVALSANNTLVNLTSDRLQVANAAVSYLTKSTALTSNNAVVNLVSDRLQVANAAVTYLTKATALTTNNALVNLVNDRLQVANAAVTYVTKAVHLTSNNALVNLINDRYQVANLSSDLVSYWPSANIIAYVASAGSGGTMNANTSIFIAAGDETKAAIPYSNTNHISVLLNGVRLTPGQDYTADDNTNIGNMLPLAAGDVLMVTEYKQHTANVLTRSSGGGGSSGAFQGSSYGFASSQTGAPSASPYNGINRWPFSSDTNATEVSDYFPSGPLVYAQASQSSATDGFNTGIQYPTYPVNYILKFPFSSYGPATDVGDLSVSRTFQSGASSIPAGYGYTAGGIGDPASPPAPSNVIDKFPFAISSSTATDVGDLTVVHYGNAGHSSTTHGYTSGGGPGAFPSASSVGNVIEKWPFSSDTNATDVGDLAAACHPSYPGLYNATGNSSDSNGYASHGCGLNPAATNWAWNNSIQKFPFSSDTNATDVADVASCTSTAAGSSSTTNGYSAGGYGGAPGSDRTVVVDKFPFSSDTNASSVLNLAVCSQTHVGHQV